MKHLKNLLEGFFKSEELTRMAKVFHGEFSYELVPNTAIRDFYNMNKVTFIESGDCYVCVFDAPQYQGQYRIVGPGEKVVVGDCGSIVVSTQTFPVDVVRNNTRPPDGFWELSGPMYLFHFSPGYRYV
jgi:hypothetical protein